MCRRDIQAKIASKTNGARGFVRFFIIFLFLPCFFWFCFFFMQVKNDMQTPTFYERPHRHFIIE